MSCHKRYQRSGDSMCPCSPHCDVVQLPFRDLSDISAEQPETTKGEEKKGFLGYPHLPGGSASSTLRFASPSPARWRWARAKQHP